MASPSVPPRPGAARARRFAQALRTEGATPNRRAAAVGLGVFIGCTPFYGAHLALSYAAASLLGLSRVMVYLAANISNPAVAPFLVFAEVQVGSVIRRGAAHPLTVEALRAMRPWSFGADVLVGAAVIGTLLGAIAAIAVRLSLRAPAVPDRFETLAARAADRYVDASLTGWEFGRAKLRADPVYRAALCDDLLPSGDRLVDFGCGQGLMLALLCEAEDAWRDGGWPAPGPPRFGALDGVEPRAGVARLARLATAGRAAIHQVDGRVYAFPPASAVLCFDVLHMMPPADQERLLARIREALHPAGVLLVREADAASPRFWRVRAGNRLKALAIGAWRQPLCFRTAGEWEALFGRLGFAATRVASSGQGAFGNVLFRLTPAASVAAVVASGAGA